LQELKSRTAKKTSIIASSHKINFSRDLSSLAKNDLNAFSPEQCEKYTPFMHTPLINELIKQRKEISNGDKKPVMFSRILPRKYQHLDSARCHPALGKRASCEGSTNFKGRRGSPPHLSGMP